MYNYVLYCLYIYIGGGGNIKMQEEELFAELDSILAFSTGARKVPPVGFSPEPSINFHTESPYPMANTCANCLSLPLSTEDYGDFKNKFILAINDSVGFGQV